MSEGIQQGHMSLQYKSLAIVVGAKGDEIAKVAEALKQEPRANTQAAERILQEIRQQSSIANSDFKEKVKSVHRSA